MRTQTTRAYSGRVAANVALGDFGLQRTAVGNYTVTLPAGMRLIAVLAVPSSGAGMVSAAIVSDRAFNVVTTNGVNATQDLNFAFTAQVAA